VSKHVHVDLRGRGDGGVAELLSITFRMVALSKTTSVAAL
jgi:hypothetical protein